MPATTADDRISDLLIALCYATDAGAKLGPLTFTLTQKTAVVDVLTLIAANCPTLLYDWSPSPGGWTVSVRPKETRP